MAAENVSVLRSFSKIEDSPPTVSQLIPCLMVLTFFLDLLCDDIPVWYLAISQARVSMGRFKKSYRNAF